MLEFTVQQNFDGKTLREYLAERGFSSTLVKRYKFHGKMLVNGHAVEVNRILKEGDFVQLVEEFRLQTPQFAPQSANVLFADKFLYVAEKPYGMPTHPDRTHRNDTLGNALATYFKGDFELRITTRLDKTTSGLVLGALDAATANLLNVLQQNHGIEKLYQAEVEGCFEKPRGTIDLPLLRIDSQNKTIVDENGKESCTLFEVAKQNSRSSLLWVTPKTGRTHQIRAHLAALGHPVCGDVLYGAKPDVRIKLHCAQLSFVHPVTKEKIEIRCPAEFWKD